MTFLYQTFRVSAYQRRMILCLTIVLALTSSCVQAQEMPSMIPMPPESTRAHDVSEGLRSLVVPTSASIVSGPPAPILKVVHTMRVTATAYSSFIEECDDTPSIAADGSRVYDGMIAANFLAFGTRVRIPELFGDKIFIVHDRMHPRFSNRIDVWMPSRSLSYQFGLHRNVRIDLLDQEQEP